MSRPLNIFIALLLCLIVTSCLNNDKGVELSRDCYLSSVTLGTMRRTNHMKKWSDSLQAYWDSTYITTYNGSYYRMSIDQLRGTVSNPDSLLHNTILGKALLNISASGTVIYRPENQLEEEWTTFSSSDSVDISGPVLLRVYSTDGSCMREYRMTLNVHQQDPDGFTWTRMEWASPLGEYMGGAAAGVRTVKAAWSSDFGALMLMVTRTGDDGHDRTSCMFTCPDRPGNEWIAMTPTSYQPDIEGEATTLLYSQRRYWASTLDGALARTDGTATFSWERIGTPFPLRLIAAHDTLLYALRTDSLSMWHAGPAMKWEMDECDTPAMLPTGQSIGTGYDMPAGGGRVMMVGLHGSDPLATVWGKTVTPKQETQWAHYPWRHENYNPLPALKDMSLTRYNGGLVAIGGSLDAAYHSIDNGVTWKKDYSWSLPEGLDASMPTTITADDKGRVWLINGTAVYCGHANTLK